MNLSKYNSVNEEIKQFISNCQQGKEFNFKEFEKLHDKLFNIVAKKRKDLALYEDILLKMLNSVEELKKGNTETLVNKGTENYHYFLWKLHDRIIKKEKALKIKELPKYLRTFNKVLKSPKYFLKQEEDFFICSRIGLAVGHQTTIKIFTRNKGVSVEYNDHDYGRCYALREQLIRRKFVCSDISVLKDVFDKRRAEGKDNYLFKSEKEYEKQEDLEKEILLFGQEMNLLIDCDHLLVDVKTGTEEEFKNEAKILSLALFLWENFALKPKNFCDVLLPLIRASCNL